MKLVANESVNKNANILGMANLRAKQGETWDSGLIAEHMQDNINLVMFKVILRSLKQTKY